MSGFEYLGAATRFLSSLLTFDCTAVYSLVASGDPIALSAALFAAVVLYCFIGGLATNTYSFVDQLWSLLPVAYTWVFAAFGGSNPRVWLMALLITLWGARLTYNFARKGGMVRVLVDFVTFLTYIGNSMARRRLQRC